MEHVARVQSEEDERDRRDALRAEQRHEQEWDHGSEEPDEHAGHSDAAGGVARRFLAFLLQREGAEERAGQAPDQRDEREAADRQHE